MNEFFTWSSLATFAGCATATAVVTQFLKGAGPFRNIATQWVSYGIALVLLFAATYFTGGLTASAAALIPFNAVLVSLAANGAYSAVARAGRAAAARKADGDVPAGAASGNAADGQQDAEPAAGEAQPEEAQAESGANAPGGSGNADGK